MDKKPAKSINRMMSGLVLVVFSATNLNGSLYAAVPSLPPVAAVEMKNFPADITSLRLPARIGKIEDSYQGSGNQVVVVIQDAHAIPDAQKGIQKIIAHFQKKYGVHTVALEGASSQLDPQFFKSFPDKELLRKVFSQYLHRGELTAGTGAAIFSNDSGTVFHGVEDWGLYEQGLGLYLAAMKDEEGLLKKVEGGRSKVEGEKKKIYSEKLFEIDQKLESFRRNKWDLVNMMKALAAVKRPSLAKACGRSKVEGGGSKEKLRLTFPSTLDLPPSTCNHQSLAAFLEEIESEGQDNTPLEMEVKRVAEKIKQSIVHRPQSIKKAAPQRSLWTVDRRLWTEFNAKYQDFQTSRISAQAFALYLKELVNRRGAIHGARSQGAIKGTGAINSPGAINRAPTFQFSKRLSHLMAHQKTLRDIEGTKFLRDFERYAQSVKESLMTMDEQRKLDAQTRELDLMEKLVKLELSREDWNQVKERRGDTVTRRMGEEKELAAHFAFYQNAELRDQAFLKNLTRFFSASPRHRVSQSALLVAGGFHAQGLTQRLREQNISYLLVMPKIGTIPENTHYREHMRGDVSWKKYFKVENGRINLYKAFVRAVRDRLVSEYGGNGVSERNHLPRYPDTPTPRYLLKSWRDQIIRDLAEKRQIEKAGEYTKFIDELIQVEGRRSKVEGKSNAGLSFDLRPPTFDLQQAMSKIDRFIAGLRQLQSENKLTEPNIINLLKPAAVPEVALSAGLAPGNEIRSFDALAEAAAQMVFSTVRAEARGFFSDNLEFNRRVISSETADRVTAPEIQMLFHTAKEMGLHLIISGGTARDFAVATTTQTRLPFPSTTDFDVFFALPTGQESQGNVNQEAYQEFADGKEIEREGEKVRIPGVKDRLLAMGYDEKTIRTLYMDLLPGVFVVAGNGKGAYVLENLLRGTDRGNAFSISRLAVEEKDGQYVIFGSQQAIKDLEDKKLRIWIETDQGVGYGMALKMMGKYSIYRDFGGFQLEENSKQLLVKEIDKMGTFSPERFKGFVAQLVGHMIFLKENSDFQSRFNKTLDEFQLDQRLGKPKEEIISQAMAYAARAQRTPSRISKTIVEPRHEARSKPEDGVETSLVGQEMLRVILNRHRVDLPAVKDYLLNKIPEEAASIQILAPGPLVYRFLQYGFANSNILSDDLEDPVWLGLADFVFSEMKLELFTQFLDKNPKAANRLFEHFPGFKSENVDLKTFSKMLGFDFLDEFISMTVPAEAIEKYIQGALLQESDPMNLNVKERFKIFHAVSDFYDRFEAALKDPDKTEGIKERINHILGYRGIVSMGKQDSLMLDSFRYVKSRSAKDVFEFNFLILRENGTVENFKLLLALKSSRREGLISREEVNNLAAVSEATHHDGSLVPVQVMVFEDAEGGIEGYMEEWIEGPTMTQQYRKHRRIARKTGSDESLRQDARLATHNLLRIYKILRGRAVLDNNLENMMVREGGEVVTVDFGWIKEIELSEYLAVIIHAYYRGTRNDKGLPLYLLFEIVQEEFPEEAEQALKNLKALVQRLLGLKNIESKKRTQKGKENRNYDFYEDKAWVQDGLDTLKPSERKDKIYSNLDRLLSEFGRSVLRRIIREIEVEEMKERSEARSLTSEQILELPRGSVIKVTDKTDEVGERVLQLSGAPQKNGSDINLFWWDRENDVREMTVFTNRFGDYTIRLAEPAAGAVQTETTLRAETREGEGDPDLAKLELRRIRGTILSALGSKVTVGSRDEVGETADIAIEIVPGKRANDFRLQLTYATKQGSLPLEPVSLSADVLGLDDLVKELTEIKNLKDKMTETLSKMLPVWLGIIVVEGILLHFLVRTFIQKWLLVAAVGIVIAFGQWLVFMLFPLLILRGEDWPQSYRVHPSYRLALFGIPFIKKPGPVAVDQVIKYFWLQSKPEVSGLKDLEALPLFRPVKPGTRAESRSSRLRQTSDAQRLESGILDLLGVFSTLDRSPEETARALERLRSISILKEHPLFTLLENPNVYLAFADRDIPIKKIAASHPDIMAVQIDAESHSVKITPIDVKLSLNSGNFKQVQWAADVKGKNLNLRGVFEKGLALLDQRTMEGTDGRQRGLAKYAQTVLEEAVEPLGGKPLTVYGQDGFFIVPVRNGWNLGSASQSRHLLLHPDALEKMSHMSIFQVRSETRTEVELQMEDAGEQIDIATTQNLGMKDSGIQLTPTDYGINLKNLSRTEMRKQDEQEATALLDPVAVKIATDKPINRAEARAVKITYVKLGEEELYNRLRTVIIKYYESKKAEPDIDQYVVEALEASKQNLLDLLQAMRPQGTGASAVHKVMIGLALGTETQSSFEKILFDVLEAGDNVETIVANGKIGGTLSAGLQKLDVNLQPVKTMTRSVVLIDEAGVPVAVLGRYDASQMHDSYIPFRVINVENVDPRMEALAADYAQKIEFVSLIIAAWYAQRSGPKGDSQALKAGLIKELGRIAALQNVIRYSGESFIIDAEAAWSNVLQTAEEARRATGRAA